MNIITFSELQSCFNDVLNTVPDKIFLIDNELTEILKYISNEELKHRGSFLKNPKILSNSKPTNIFRLQLLKSDKYYLKESFEAFIIYDKYDIPVFENEMEEHSIRRKKVIKQAEEFAIYYKWLKSLQSTTKIPTVKQNRITLHEKMLLLYYLGFEPNKYVKTDVAEILFLILGLDKDKSNLTKSLSHISTGENKVRTLKNLTSVMQLFEKYGLTETSNRVLKDIKNLGYSLELPQ